LFTASKLAVNNLKTKTMKTYFLLILIITLLISCENNVIEKEIIEESDNCDSGISFSQEVKPIIDNNCVQCHNGNRFPDLRTYQSISDNSSTIKEEVESRRMPIGNSLSQTEIDAIVCWINNGSVNN